MRILFTGATGLIGSRLVHRLAGAGHELTILSRSPDKARGSLKLDARYFRWDSENESIPAGALDQVEAVIHLAGESIASGAWSPERKKRILESREKGGVELARAIRAHGKSCRTFISASAVGFYGNRGDEILTELSERGEGFLSEVCVKWERPLAELPSSVRSIALRLGVVLTPEGGALKKMLPVFRAGIGGKLGNGRQWVSWIHLEDVLRAIEFALENESIRGPVNLTAPEPVQQSEFARRLAGVLHRPAILPMPGFTLRLILGEMADLVLSSQRVLPESLKKAGFQFRFSSLRRALEDLLGVA